MRILKTTPSSDKTLSSSGGDISKLATRHSASVNNNILSIPDYSPDVKQNKGVFAGLSTNSGLGLLKSSSALAHSNSVVDRKTGSGLLSQIRNFSINKQVNESDNDISIENASSNSLPKSNSNEALSRRAKPKKPLVRKAPIVETVPIAPCDDEVAAPLFSSPVSPSSTTSKILDGVPPSSPIISSPDINRVPAEFIPIAFQPEECPNMDNNRLFNFAYGISSLQGSRHSTAASSASDLTARSSAPIETYFLNNADAPPLPSNRFKEARRQRAASTASVTSSKTQPGHRYFAALNSSTETTAKSKEVSSYFSSISTSLTSKLNSRSTIYGSSNNSLGQRATSFTERDGALGSYPSLALSSTKSLESRKKSTHSVIETFNIAPLDAANTSRPDLTKIKEKLRIDQVEGSTINQYVVIRDIGEGSFSKVLLVYNNDDGRYYACKSISKKRLRKKSLWRNGPKRKSQSTSADPSSVRASEERKTTVDYMDFVRHEIAILKKLSKHPHISTLYEVVEDRNSDILYMVFELCEFGSIMKLKMGETVPCFSENLARRYFRGILLGLEYLHYVGVVHRDIKPDNILLNASNNAVVGDFSISYCSNVLQRSTNGSMTDVAPPPATTGNHLLTPMFTPPEFTESRESPSAYSTEADIWSLGMTLYCFVHGRTPFDVDTIENLYKAIRESPIRKKDGISRELSELLDRMFERDPRARITMSDIKSHPWVTQNGHDPMPSKEENCVHLLNVTQADLDSALTPAI